MNYIREQQMKPEKKSQNLLSVTRAKAKMFEYGIPEDAHINISDNPNKLFTVSISLLGDFTAALSRGESGDIYLLELKRHLNFAAYFFDSYYQSKLDKTLDPYLILMGSAAYYLCDLPGNSLVLAKIIDSNSIDIGCNGLETLLVWILQSKFDIEIIGAKGIFCEYIVFIPKLLQQFFKMENNEKELRAMLKDFRQLAYEIGKPRELLLVDIIIAIIIRKIENSTRKVLPKYSELSEDKWSSFLEKPDSIKEFWPAQHLLGERGVFKGKSAIVQMPTSAGKTKAIELIIRSAFLARRASLSIVIAPFKALCNEIKNSLSDAFHNEIKVDELSDVLQADFEITKLLDHKQILVVTPEKLFYILRHNPELAEHIGLLIFDEGHQFDSGVRGITYELLLTSLKFMIHENTQKILISAVISNADKIGEWLNRTPNVINGSTLTATFKSIGFTSWLDQLGRIEYVNAHNIENNEFFVPRVIEKISLARKERERKNRYFPEKEDGQSIALYLGLKLVPNGSIAIFSGRKDTAAKICEKITDIVSRNIPLPLPSEFSDNEEIERLKNLHIANLGSASSASISAGYGIFSHHGNIPHGIRISVEHAMRENLIRFVVCTSTLAQGVNLPIRYLIVSSVYQGGERIKVRDFHNLIGRAGRSGMHTEGSILFADPIVYDKRYVFKEKWRWEQVKELLDPNNSEPCISNLLSIFDPIKSDDGKSILDIDALLLVEWYINSPDEIERLTSEIAKKDKNFSYTGVQQQIFWKIDLVCSVESFLLSYWDYQTETFSGENIVSLVESTLAFFLANEQEKENLKKLFNLLAQNISVNLTNPLYRKVYGKTLYGINDSKIILEWLNNNVNDLIQSRNIKDIYEKLWEIVEKYIRNSSFNKFNRKDVLKEIVMNWIAGHSFYELFLLAETCRIGEGERPRKVKIENIIDIFERGIAYDGVLLINALIEFLELIDLNDYDSKLLFERLQFIQKQFKYGLPSKTSIILYELGFSDRTISQELIRLLDLTSNQKDELLEELKQKAEIVKDIMDRYPSYFQKVMLRILEEFKQF